MRGDRGRRAARHHDDTVGDSSASSTSWVTISTVLRCVFPQRHQLVLQLHPG